MAFRDAAHIFQRLRNGTVPDRGLDAFAVGIEKHRKELQRKLEEVRGGEGDVKFLRGDYGCGKTFMANLVIHDAKERGFATSFVVVSDNDLHFYKSTSSTACSSSARAKTIPNSSRRYWPSSTSADGRHRRARTTRPGRVVRKIFELKQAGKPQEATALISWLSGSANVSAPIKNLAGVKGDIESSDSMAYLRGILEIVKSAGYKGLVIVIVEVETILRMRGDVRQKSMNAIRQIVDASSTYPGLLWVFTAPRRFSTIAKASKASKPCTRASSTKSSTAPRACANLSSDSYRSIASASSKWP